MKYRCTDNIIQEGDLVKRFLTVVIALMAFVFTISACMSYPVYEWLPSDREFGEMIDIDGVAYRELPMTMWRPDIYNQERFKIGRLKGPDITFSVYAYGLDIERVFINYEREGFVDADTSRWLYRKDIELPEFSAENVSSISFSKWGNHSKTEPFNNTVTDPQVIDEYFRTHEKAAERSGGGNIPLGTLYLSNAEYQSLCVIMKAGAYEGKYWISFNISRSVYAEAPQDLMEKLVGEKLPPAEEFIEQYNAERD